MTCRTESDEDTIEGLLMALRRIYTKLDQPIHHNEMRNPMACNLLRDSASDARAIASAAIARAQGEEE